VFAAAGLTAVSIAMLTVGWQAMRAAVGNPAKEFAIGMSVLLFTDSSRR